MLTAVNSDEVTSMASTDASLQSTTETEGEIEILRSKFPRNVKVLCDMGDFKFIIDVKTSKFTLKFQIDGSYPLTAPQIIIRSDQLPAEQKVDLTTALRTKSSTLIGQPMLSEITMFAVSEMEEIPTTESLKPKSQRKRKEKKGKKTIEDTPLDTKLPSLRTAEDVISRIHWDPELDRETFIVGYLDRFLGVIEKDFNVLSWEDIASVDYNTLAVPKHRIQYFKYKKMKVWDKKDKLDLVFGSYGCGKTIHDVIKEYKDEDYEEDVDVNAEGDSDGTTGCEEKPRKKARPTHFLALRITDPAIRAAVSEIQDDILDKVSNNFDGVIPCERLHITICCLGLDTEEAVERAAQKLEALRIELAAWEPHKMEIQLENVDHFFHSCLYAKVTPNKSFTEYGNFLRAKVHEMGIECRDDHDFVPHMTLLKLPRQKFNENHTSCLDSRIFTDYLGTEFGTQTADNIHLCSMSNDRSSDGFYKCAKVITFP